MKNILIAAHDAGGAEVVSAWVKKNLSQYNFTYLLAGPALTIFQRKLDKINLCSVVDVEARTDFDFVLTGSSLVSDLERNAITFAQKSGITVATYLDHWVNYSQRFQVDGKIVLPDQIWVGDEHALKIASQEFSGTKIKLVHNNYFDEMVKAIESFSSENFTDRTDERKRILYVCEPQKAKSSNPNLEEYTEFAALEGYLDYLSLRVDYVECVRVRLHPSEKPGKYEVVIDKYCNILPIEVSCNTSLVHDCAWADWIVGCDSMTMVIGILVKKQVFSCIPENGRAMTLPYKEIKQVFKKTHPTNL